METINAVGRRKAAVVRVFLTKGKGNIIINGKDYKEYFPIQMLQAKVLQPLQIIKVEGEFDITMNATGGGVKGQAEAAKLGIARALVKLDAENKPALKAEGLMTRDSRRVERKKYGLRKARRATQFSKR
ncbi:MAG: 30S ribosomal protein S9 [Bacteroidetes bacterium]|nr:30S ribosomal protein S9 [Bacteroidota bacterium]MBP7399165.1 30S ribosomal protein S9 [Chitinophagales bacterium]MBK7108070.1 30S ribosomal protein S9 [Bacteroidota bacterium]MBK8486496.1 30S ribosomal protein S9 [Bacteroidota bacterium]MBK8683281.1 30S ribosomal protein S9 [Bacteroidota bacterium]